MSTKSWPEYLRAIAEAHRLQAEQYAAQERAYLLHPLTTPNESHIAHLREMQESYHNMANEALAEAFTTALEGTQP